jgi:creatinine amidohydrolase
MSGPVFSMSDHDFQIALKKTKRAIVPIGSLEQHGGHLPISTDSLIVDYLARMVAEKVGAFVLPVISYGISFEHKPMFNVSLHNSTVSLMMRDICMSLSDNGIKKIIILNGHHGNMGALQYIAQELANKIPKSASVHTLHYWHQMINNEFDHAGEVETSLVLAVAPKLVRMDKAVPNSKKLLKSKAAYSSITNAPGSFPKITGNGVWGDPRSATTKKGEKWIEEIATGLAKTITELG